MSDRVIQSHYDGEQSYHDGDGRAESIHSYQSVWMAHWTRTSCRAAPHVHNSASLRSSSNDDNDANKCPLLSGLAIASDISKSTKGFTEVTEARAVRVINEGLIGSSKTLINERLGSQTFPMFNICQNTSSGLDLKNDPEISCRRIASRPVIDCNIEYNAHTTGSHFPSILAVAPPAKETSSRECRFQSQVASHSSKKGANPPVVVGDDSLALAGPCQDNFIGSTQLLPYKFNRGKTSMSSFMGGQEKHHQLSSILASKEPLTNTNITILEHEDDNYEGRSASLVFGKKRDDHSTFGNSFLRKSNASMFLDDPSTSNNNLPVLVGEQYEKMQNCSGTGIFPSRNSPPVETKPEKLHVGCYSLQRMPPSMNDKETLRIGTANSVEELTGGPAAVSQTPHSLSFRKKTDMGLSKKNQTLQESRVSTKLKGNMFSELLSLSPPFDLGEKGVKIQPLGSSTDSEGNDNVEDSETCKVCSKNESSAETDTMDMDTLKERNDISDVYSSPSDKKILVDENLPSQAIIASVREEVQCRWALTRLPDINEEIPALQAATDSMDNPEPSSSRTQSMDAEHLLSHAEQFSKINSSSYPSGLPRSEPTSRWLKRLRRSTSDSFGLGTKCSNLGEVPSHEKVNKFFSKIMKSAKNGSSEPLSGKFHGKEEMAADRSTILSQNGESSSVDLLKKDHGILLSHPWIRRWCHNRAATQQKTPEALVASEPKTTIMEFGELQNKQFPSIAAMALMGKAMNGFQQCEFQRKGSSVLWNTKGS